MIAIMMVLTTAQQHNKSNLEDLISNKGAELVLSHLCFFFILGAAVDRHPEHCRLPCYLWTHRLCSLVCCIHGTSQNTLKNVSQGSVHYYLKAQL